jgi:hypothetical protein
MANPVMSNLLWFIGTKHLFTVRRMRHSGRTDTEPGGTIVKEPLNEVVF